MITYVSGCSMPFESWFRIAWIFCSCKKEELSIITIHKGGSIGKKTAIWLKIDFDILVFVDEQETPPDKCPSFVNRIQAVLLARFLLDEMECTDDRFTWYISLVFPQRRLLLSIADQRLQNSLLMQIARDSIDWGRSDSLIWLSSACMRAQFLPGFLVWYNCGSKFEGGTQWKISGETVPVSFAACPSKQQGPEPRTHYPVQKTGSVCQQPCSNFEVLGQLSPLTWWPKFEERLQFSDGVDCDRGSKKVQQWYAQGAEKCIDLDPWFSEDLHHTVTFLF